MGVTIVIGEDHAPVCALIGGLAAQAPDLRVVGEAAEASGADAFLLKKTLMTALVPTIRRLLAATSPPRTRPEGSRGPIADRGMAADIPRPRGEP
jgi:hypothetical protein